MGNREINLWLDDVRPIREGYNVHVKTVKEAKEYFLQGVNFCSLDHDLGICDLCTPGEINQGINLVIVKSLEACCDVKSCACPCHETGSHLVNWLVKTGNWSQKKPFVHSANPVGAKYMRGMIDKYWK